MEGITFARRIIERKAIALDVVGRGIRRADRATIKFIGNGVCYNSEVCCQNSIVLRCVRKAGILRDNCAIDGPTDETITQTGCCCEVNAVATLNDCSVAHRTIAIGGSGNGIAVVGNQRQGSTGHTVNGILSECNLRIRDNHLPLAILVVCLEGNFVASCFVAVDAQVAYLRLGISHLLEVGYTTTFVVAECSDLVVGIIRQCGTRYL